MIIWVLLAAYNEEKNIGCILNDIKAKGLKTLVVDDGSIDKTYPIAVGKADQVIKNEKNCGKGCSLKRGIDYLLSHEKFDYILMMDADSQHACTDIDKFLEKAKARAYFVVGNRMASTLKMPWLRVVTNIFMSSLISRLTKQDIADSQCGFRLIKKDVLERVKLKTNHFEIESELLIKAARLGFPIESIPIESIYFKKQESKINPVLDTIRFIKFILSVLKYYAN